MKHATHLVAIFHINRSVWMTIVLQSKLISSDVLPHSLWNNTVVILFKTLSPVQATKGNCFLFGWAHCRVMNLKTQSQQNHRQMSHWLNWIWRRKKKLSHAFWIFVHLLQIAYNLYVFTINGLQNCSFFKKQELSINFSSPKCLLRSFVFQIVKLRVGK